jgi:hypothetical protein
LTEALPVTLLLGLFISGLMLVAYLLFARSTIQYQSEQALYCAAQKSKRQSECSLELKQAIEQALPWGDISVDVEKQAQKWTAEVKWTYQGYSFNVYKELTPKQILNAKALPW